MAEELFIFNRQKALVPYVGNLFIMYSAGTVCDKPTIRRFEKDVECAFPCQIILSPALCAQYTQMSL